MVWGRRAWCGGGGHGVGEEGMVWGRRAWCGGGGHGVGEEGMVWGRRAWCGGGGHGVGVEAWRPKGEACEAAWGSARLHSHLPWAR